MVDTILNMPDVRDSNIPFNHALPQAPDVRDSNINLEQAFAEARPRLLRLARLSGVVPDHIEDVVQETLVEAWRHLDRLREPQHFHAWLDGICRNVCRRQRRAWDNILSLHEPLSGSLSDSNEAAEMGRAFDLLDPSTPDPLEELSQQDLATLLNRAMGHLPAHTRELLEMCYLAEFPQREVAAHLGLTIGALELRLHRARHRLRQLLTGPLRAEAQHFGLFLDLEDAQNWQVTRQWCWLCGKHKMLARFETGIDGHVDLCMRCPECCSRYNDMFMMHSMGMTSLNGLHTFRPALKRVIQDMSKLSSWTATAGKCYHCQESAAIRIFRSSESPVPLPPDRYWLGINCPRCGNMEMDIASIVVSNPVVQRFVLQHERFLAEPCRLIEHNGVQVFCIRMVDLTSAGQLTALVDAQTLRCLATFTE